MFFSNYCLLIACKCLQGNTKPTVLQYSLSLQVPCIKTKDFSYHYRVADKGWLSGDLIS